jgi:glycosyltransferase involved in cell wall biosynthesis
VVAVTVISVVTPVYDGGHHFLGEAYASLLDQELPDDWTWQWVVQEDGETGVPATVLPTDDPRISYGMGRRGGAAMARTMATARVTGVLVRGLDADDLLPPGALARDITTLTEHPEIGWVVSGCLDLLPDGTLRPGPADPPAGPLAPGVMAAGYQAGLVPVMGTTLTAYTDLVHAVGGWQAVPASEDVALLLACEAVAPGWMLSEPGEIYRRHPDQVTAQPAHWDQAERTALESVTLARLRALSHFGWRWSPQSAHHQLIAPRKAAL